MNEHITNYLDYYIKLKEIAGYAVMIGGDWGSGKTWYINEYISEKRSNDLKFLRISLYGITSFADIDTQVFQQLHPVLSSKAMMLTGKFLKGAVKLGLKVDLNGDGKTDTTINLQALEDNFTKENIDKFIVVFDDLERSKLEQSVVMGYINALVEQQGMKVIILSDETKIEDKKYYEIKEKTIGISFQVSHDTDQIFDHFTKKIATENVRVVLEKNKINILEIYEKAGYRNLRHLLQSMYGFEYFLRYLARKYIDNKALLIELTKQYFIFSIEVKYNSNLLVKVDDIEEAIADDSAKRALSTYNVKSEESNENLDTTSDVEPLVKIVNKHKLGSSTILLSDLWMKILSKGIINEKDISKSLDSSPFMINETSPEWKQLWHYLSLDDGAFEKLLATVVGNFAKKEYKNTGEILHVSAMLLSFSKLFLYQKRVESILKEIKQYFTEMFEKDVFPEEEIQYFMRYHDHGWDGLGFHDDTSEEYKLMRQYFVECATLREEERMQVDSKKISEYIASGEIEKVRQLFFDHHNQTPMYFYKYKPILKYVDANELVKAMLQTNNKNIWEFSHLLKARYENTTLKVIREENQFLSTFREALREKGKEHFAKVRGVIIGRYNQYFLDEYINKGSQKDSKSEG